MICPSGPCRSEMETLTLLSPPNGARATSWKDSYSPRAAEISAVKPAPAASAGPTRFMLEATQTIGLDWAPDPIGKNTRVATVNVKADRIQFMHLAPRMALNQFCFQTVSSLH